jgi:hypothetical protein
MEVGGVAKLTEDEKVLILTHMRQIVLAHSGKQVAEVYRELHPEADMTEQVNAWLARVVSAESAFLQTLESL